MVTPAMGAAMISPMYSLRENRAHMVVGFIWASLLFRALSGAVAKHKACDPASPNLINLTILFLLISIMWWKIKQ